MALVQLLHVPTWTLFEIQTPVRGAPSATTEDATLSTSNQRSRVSFDDLRRNTNSSWHAFKSVITEPAHIPLDSFGSNLESWQMTLGEETALLRIAVPVSEKKLRCVRTGPRKKSCTQAIAPSNSWWLLSAPFELSKKPEVVAKGALTTSTVSWKVCNFTHQNYQVKHLLHVKTTKRGMCHTSKWPDLIMPYYPKSDTNSIEMAAKTEARLVATETKNLKVGGMHPTTLVFLSLLAHKRVEFCLSSLHLTAPYPARTEKTVHKLPRKVKRRVIVFTNKDLRRETANALSKKRTCCHSW